MNLSNFDSPILNSTAYSVSDNNGNNSFKSTVEPKNNCGVLNGTISIHNQTNLLDDVCSQTERNNQNIEASDYNVSNFASCDKNLISIINKATENKGVPLKDGFDVSPNKVNEHSKIRQGAYESRPKMTQQLFERPYKTVPYMGRGRVDNDIETKLQHSEITYRDNFVGFIEQQDKTFDNILTPLIKNVKDNVQKVDNLIEGVNDNRDFFMIRGGVPSRQIVKELDYFSRSKDSDENKEYMRDKKYYMNEYLN